VETLKTVSRVETLKTLSRVETLKTVSRLETFENGLQSGNFRKRSPEWKL
jgi:hypothetical protein